jgi:hypothetical protein
MKTAPHITKTILASKKETHITQGIVKLTTYTHLLS